MKIQKVVIDKIIPIKVTSICILLLSLRINLFGKKYRQIVSFTTLIIPYFIVFGQTSGVLAKSEQMPGVVAISVEMPGVEAIKGVF